MDRFDAAQAIQLEEELRLHLELAGEQVRREGATADQASRAARLRAGGIAQALFRPAAVVTLSAGQHYS